MRKSKGENKRRQIQTTMRSPAPTDCLWIPVILNLLFILNIVTISRIYYRKGRSTPCSPPVKIPICPTMIIPKMGVNEIVKPNGNLVLYNAIKNEHVDFCVVKISNMEPIAVLDTYYPSITDSTIQEINPAVKKALKSVDIPVISYEILDVPYDKSKVFATFLDAIDPVSLAELKNSKK